MSSLYDWKRVWVWTAPCQDIKRRVWCRYVWRTHTPGIPGAYLSYGGYVYRYWKPIA